MVRSFFFLIGFFSVSPPSSSFLSCFDLRPTNTRITPGLIVISAHYGLASSFTERGIIVSEKIDQEGEGEIIDVTIPVQALVQDGRLYIPGGKGKHNIIGFYVSFFAFHKSLEQGRKMEEEEKSHDSTGC